jgi:hypothetical protein
MMHTVLLTITLLPGQDKLGEVGDASHGSHGGLGGRACENGVSEAGYFGACYDSVCGR